MSQDKGGGGDVIFTAESWKKFIDASKNHGMFSKQQELDMWLLYKYIINVFLNLCILNFVPCMFYVVHSGPTCELCLVLDRPGHKK
jgi:hypothetical protein